MKKFAVVVCTLTALLVGALPASADPPPQKRPVISSKVTRPDLKSDAELKPYLWLTLGGNPRKGSAPDKMAISTWEEYRQWFLSMAGIQDMGRVKLPEDVKFYAVQLVKSGKWEQRVVFTDGTRASIERVWVPKGTLLDFLTFGPTGVVIEKVLMGFGAWTRQITVIQPAEGNRWKTWKLRTFEKCANAGRTLTLLELVYGELPPDTPPQRVTTEIPGEERPGYKPTMVGYVEVRKAPRHTVSAPGFIGGLLNIVARWVGRSVSNLNISQAPVQYGSTANGGSASTGNVTTGAVTVTSAPISVQQQQGQGQSTTVDTNTNVDVDVDNHNDIDNTNVNINPVDVDVNN